MRKVARLQVAVVVNTLLVIYKSPYYSICCLLWQLTFFSLQLEKDAKNDELSHSVNDLKERWLKLRHQLRLALSGQPFEISSSILTHNGNGTSLGDGPGSTASVSSCETTHETQASRTTYYNSQVILSVGVGLVLTRTRKMDLGSSSQEPDFTIEIVVLPRRRML